MKQFLLILLLLPVTALAVDAYDPETGVVYMPDVRVGEEAYEVLMTNQGDLVFKVTFAEPTSPIIPTPDVFDAGTGILTMPSVKLGDDLFEVEMMHLGDLVFKVIAAGLIDDSNGPDSGIPDQLNLTGVETSLFGELFTVEEKNTTAFGNMAILEWEVRDKESEYGSISMRMSITLQDDEFMSFSYIIDVLDPETGESDQLSYGPPCPGPSAELAECFETMDVTYDGENYIVTFDHTELQSLLNPLTVTGTLISGDD